MIADSQCYFFSATFYCKRETFHFFQSGGFGQSLSSPAHNGPFLGFPSPAPITSSMLIPRLIPSFTACNPAYASAVNGSSMLE
ncbi:hypothetical protein ERO13_D02G031114v2 [Gossypium hirsutum]|uniref:Uncharacterized protein n=1 Tax=Gossypium barbadense TaxID=3634 RepID=A0A5J5S845_GOSBA|nr:hypothetical protein ES319_D02G035800v1 [Gossypium barbadense]KAG4156953.1 hypothetical protein ERO13_D02G031114v2 [Gossypium hirsutum]